MSGTPEKTTKTKKRFFWNEAVLHRYLLWQHRWTGLPVAVVLIVVGLTGSLLAFRMQIDRLLNLDLHVASLVR